MAQQALMDLCRSRDLGDGRRLFVQPLMFGARLSIGPVADPFGFDDQW